jgi:serine/threonine-protein kinase
VNDSGSFYYVMELLDGINFEQLVKRFGPQPPARVIHLLLQACDSLAEAHQIGLVHRDVKPTIVFMCRLGLNVDFVKVLDFGLVKSMLPEGETRVTMEGMTTGTPAYMAPEVAMGNREVDGRADIYGLGCLAYWLLTGQLVFEESTPVAMVIAHVQRPLVPPSQRTELHVPPSLERVVMACLEKDPEDRPQTAIELAALLEQCREDAGGWTTEDAQRWWQVNLPGCAIAAPVEDEQEAPASK